MEEKLFTEPAVLYTITGRIFIRKDASDEYRARCLEEIENDAVYTHVMSSVPTSIKNNLLEETDSLNKDVDPIVSEFLLRGSTERQKVKMLVGRATDKDLREYVEERYLTNGFESIPQIDFNNFIELAEAATKHK